MAGISLQLLNVQVCVYNIYARGFKCYEELPYFTFIILFYYIKKTKSCQHYRWLMISR